MRKIKKVVAMCLAAAMVLSMSVCANEHVDTTELAENMAIEAGYTVVKDMIDYTVYDADMVYIQEHADRAAEYNAALKAKTTIGSYDAWSWSSDGIYSRTTGSAAGFTIDYYFTPVNNYLYFNAEITGAARVPHLAVNKLNSDGSLSYVGSYNVTSVGGEDYAWTNYRRALTAGQNYTFSLWCGSTNWDYASLDIYKSQM